MDDLLRQEIETIAKDFPEGHVGRNGRIEDACCGHLSRTAKGFWEELLEQAPLSHQRRSELFQTAINGAFQQVGVLARNCGGFEAVETFRNGLVQDAIRRQNAEVEYPLPAPKLDLARINKWMDDEGYTNESLAGFLRTSSRAISSIRNNGKYHGSDLVTKLANLMELDAEDLYVP